MGNFVTRGASDKQNMDGDNPLNDVEGEHVVDLLNSNDALDNGNPENNGGPAQNNNSVNDTVPLERDDSVSNDDPRDNDNSVIYDDPRDSNDSVIYDDPRDSDDFIIYDDPGDNDNSVIYDDPIGKNDDPIGKNDDPIGNNDDSIGNNGDPIGNIDDSIRNDSDPMGNNDDLVGNKDDPIGNIDDLIGNKSDSMGNNDEAVGNNDDPVRNNDAPTRNIGDPIGNNDDPIGDNDDSDNEMDDGDNEIEDGANWADLPMVVNPRHYSHRYSYRNPNLRGFYKCYCVSTRDGNQQHLEQGGRVLLPPSILEQLQYHEVRYPLLFKFTNTLENRSTSVGVLEFTADMDRCYIPDWIMQNLLGYNGCMMLVEIVNLPKATYCKFRPRTADFLEITDRKAVLETELRHFACLSTGDLVNIHYNDTIYELYVVETLPESSVCITECDMTVEFAPPLESVLKPKEKVVQENLAPLVDESCGFPGPGYRVDGKSVSKVSTDIASTRRGIPDYNYQVGTLNFNRDIERLREAQSARVIKKSETFNAFEGTGCALGSNNPPRQVNSCSELIHSAPELDSSDEPSSKRPRFHSEDEENDTDNEK